MVIWHGLLFTAPVTGTDEATCWGHGECSDAVRGNDWESATEDECSTGCTGIHRRQHQSQAFADPETVTLHFPREICTGHHHPSKTSFKKILYTICKGKLNQVNFIASFMFYVLMFIGLYFMGYHYFIKGRERSKSPTFQRSYLAQRPRSRSRSYERSHSPLFPERDSKLFWDLQSTM